MGQTFLSALGTSFIKTSMADRNVCPTWLLFSGLRSNRTIALLRTGGAVRTHLLVAVAHGLMVPADARTGAFDDADVVDRLADSCSPAPPSRRFTFSVGFGR